jgi:hypothetical protein
MKNVMHDMACLGMEFFTGWRSLAGLDESGAGRGVL